MEDSGRAGYVSVIISALTIISLLSPLSAQTKVWIFGKKSYICAIKSKLTKHTNIYGISTGV